MQQSIFSINIVLALFWKVVRNTTSAFLKLRKDNASEIKCIWTKVYSHATRSLVKMDSFWVIFTF